MKSMMIEVQSDFKIKRWVIRNCAVAEVKTKSRKAKEVKVNVEEKPKESTNESEVSISTKEE